MPQHAVTVFKHPKACDGVIRDGRNADAKRRRPISNGNKKRNHHDARDGQIIGQVEDGVLGVA